MTLPVEQEISPAEVAPGLLGPVQDQVLEAPRAAEAVPVVAVRRLLVEEAPRQKVPAHHVPMVAVPDVPRLGRQHHMEAVADQGPTSCALVRHLPRARVLASSEVLAEDSEAAHKQ